MAEDKKPRRRKVSVVHTGDDLLSTILGTINMFQAEQQIANENLHKEFKDDLNRVYDKIENVHEEVRDVHSQAKETNGRVNGHDKLFLDMTKILDSITSRHTNCEGSQAIQELRTQKEVEKVKSSKSNQLGKFVLNLVAFVGAFGVFEWVVRTFFK